MAPQNNNKSKIKIVSIGGGNGQGKMLSALKEYDFLDITGIVAVTDTGLSTGEIREHFGIAAPGDIRRCMISLSESESLFKDVFQYRFKKYIKGQNLGNLLLAALTDITGSFDKAVQEFSKIFKIKGTVYPATAESIDICAELENGDIMYKEHNVRKLNKPAIERLFLENPKVKGYKPAIKALKDADYIIIGPGSLFTSVLPIILIEDIRKAIISSKAKKIFISNISTQRGQTDNFTFSRHILELLRYMKNDHNSNTIDKNLNTYKGHRILDYVITNTEKPSKLALKECAKSESQYVEPSQKDLSVLKDAGIKPIAGKLIRKIADKGAHAHSGRDIYLHHDAGKLADSVLSIAAKGKQKIFGVILAAGSGQRMKPFSLSTSKAFLRFLGKPLIAYYVDDFIRNRIKDIVIICNPDNMNEIRSYFESEYRNTDIEFHFTIQQIQRGPSHALLSAEHILKHSFFILRYGDTLARDDIVRNILDQFSLKKEINGIITLEEVDDPSDYGVALFEHGKIKKIVEKPEKDKAPSKLATVGLYLLNADRFYSAIKDIGYKTVIPPPEYLLQSGYDLSFWITQSERVDVGRAFNIIQANRMLIEKYGGKILSSNIAKSSKIGKNVYIGPNAVIRENAVIGDYASVEGYVGNGSLIQNSVIMPGTKIGRKCLISDSVIGSNNIIEDNFRTNTDKSLVYTNGRYISPDMNLGLFTGDNVTIMQNLYSEPGKMVFPNKVIRNNILGDKLIRAIIFDADNTLYRTKEIAAYGDKKAISHISKLLKKNADNLYSEWLEIVKDVEKKKDPKLRHRKHSYSQLLKKHGKKSASAINKAFDIFFQEILSRIRLMPGFSSIRPILSKYNLAICTEENSEMTMAKLSKLEIAQIFDLIISSDTIGEMKPSKKYYRDVFRKFDISPNECIFIGDNFEKDLAIPKELGATTVLFGGFEDTSKADYSIKDYKQLRELLDEL